MHCFEICCTETILENIIFIKLYFASLIYLFPHSRFALLTVIIHTITSGLLLLLLHHFCMKFLVIRDSWFRTWDRAVPLCEHSFLKIILRNTRGSGIQSKEGKKNLVLKFFTIFFGLLILYHCCA